MKKQLITGNNAMVEGALVSGANMMAGYPITPTTEILEYWAKKASQDPKLKYLQTEDEMSAGFVVLGGILSGAKAFTATAGPGNILMQDPLSMAENMRLPIVVFINQRGGPSTGTVIYSQQELNLTCYGGNGEGLRVVYSVSNVQEMYDYAIKAFNTAWKYYFPTFVLSDGYLAKTMTEIDLYTPEEKNIEIIPSHKFLLKDNKENVVNLRNTYNLEKELNELLIKNHNDYQNIQNEIIEFEDYHTLDADIVIFAHGIVSSAAKEAVDVLRKENIKIGLFRPITLNPFARDTATQIAKNKKLIIVVESSLGQFKNLIKRELYGINTIIQSYCNPAIGISSNDIIKFVKEKSGDLK